MALAVDEKKGAFAKEQLVSREDISVTLLEVHRLDFITILSNLVQQSDMLE